MAHSRLNIRAVISGLLVAGSMLASKATLATERLPSFNVDLGQTTVSGLSSGGYMALQFHIAFSETVRGAGIVAGGPYFCAEGQLLPNALFRCMQTFMGAPDPVRLAGIARGFAQEGRIDRLENLADDRVYLFSGTNDRTVVGAVVEAARQFYLRAGLPAANLEFRNDVRAGHAMPTEEFGRACSLTAPPYINDCDLDLAGAILRHLYPGLRPPPAPTPRPGGTVLAFDQTEFFRFSGLPQPSTGSAPFSVNASMTLSPGMSPPGMPSMPPLGMSPGSPPGMSSGVSLLPGVAPTLSLSDTGFAYVPPACAPPRSEACRIHIAFHGCEQTVADIQEQFVRNTGYNRWAEANNIIVLYPQARHEPPPPNQNGPNPKGCWDWWGYSGAAYATKAGPQMAVLRAMLDRLAGRQ
jgi:poly(3-hydroxybutyrate) depolymerase